MAENTSDVRTGSDHASINFTVKSPELWTAETPTMYQATFTLLDKAGKTLHVEIRNLVSVRLKHVKVTDCISMVSV